LTAKTGPLIGSFKGLRNSMNFNLAIPFHEQARAHPHNLALCVSGRSYSYGELAALAGGAALALGETRTVAVLASRSLGAYVGVLGAGWGGAAYIPLNPKRKSSRELPEKSGLSN
jgi:D-alanine--poly(phosphoribitol) ligase subunit 1